MIPQSSFTCNHMTVEMDQRYDQKRIVFRQAHVWLNGLRSEVGDVARQTAQIAKDDPRRVIHSIKVGVAITVVSLFYYFQLLYSSFGVSAMWAVVTVVITFEFYAGATLGKGLNRGLATLIAGGLGLGAHYLASLTGQTSKPILTGLFVFVLAVASTYLRFFPKIKARYDYGMMMFILTFCLVSISGLRTDDVLKLAEKRLLTILLGVVACMLVSICICPVWAGEDLHRLIARQLKELGSFLEGFAGECLRRSDGAENGRPSPVSLSSILVHSKSNEETLESFARWEPGHGRFMYRHPWNQYLKIANLTKQCACQAEHLNNYLNIKTQAPQEIQEAFSCMSSETGKALKQLAWNVETMTRLCSPNPCIEHVKAESKNLMSLLKRGLWGEHSSLLQLIPVAATASLLIDTAASVENIAEAVYELSLMANFKGKEREDIGESGKANEKGYAELGLVDSPSV